jgi:hypothetical protein
MSMTVEEACESSSVAEIESPFTSARNRLPLLMK